jgi:glycosyltransferase involved in cell wall biosynthesis
MEHFGIAPVEAMSAGCIPIVFNGGGLREIVKEGYNGFLFSNEQELLQKTTEIIRNKINISESILKISASRFSEKKFVHQWKIVVE